MFYEVVVTNYNIVCVDADNAEEAKELVREMYKDEIIVDVRTVDNFRVTSDMVTEVANEVDREFDTDMICNAFEPYFDILMDRLADKYNLSDEDAMDLGCRLTWKIVLDDE